jgi:hypothetical protein
MSKRKVVAIGLSVVIFGIAAATATALKLEILDRPGGQRIGTWQGAVEVLAVEGVWAKVRMLGWVPKANVAPKAPEGVRLEGSPGGGIWVSRVHIRKDFFGDARITGWVTNATGKEFEMLSLEAVLIDDAGAVIETVPILISHIPDGTTKGFDESARTPYEQVTELMFQFNYGL